MPQSQITVEHLSKTYQVPVRDAGLRAALRNLLHRTYEDVAAVRDISFNIEQGEMVGFIGPNGAGKTTTLKMLAGVLHPSAGSARVAGFTPWERRADFLRSISMVLGNKSQLLWDIPPLDTFRVLAEIYGLSPADYAHTLDELVTLLELQPLLKKPVRNLSLGERMKCELVAGLLHRPQVIFLDEPTLGLDVSMQSRVRHFLLAYNQRHGATLMLTSHYMADVVTLCPRVILIHHGRVLYDGELNKLAEQLAPFKIIRLGLSADRAEEHPELPPYVEVLSQSDNQLELRVNRSAAPALTAQLLNTLPITDLAVEDPPIEAVIDRIYREGDV